MVTLLTATMILGLIAIFTILVIRFQGEKSIPLPTEIKLPDGKTAASFTQGPDWYAVVTTDNTILIFNRSDNSLRQTLQIIP